MPIDLTVLPHRKLAYFRYTGVMCVPDGAQAFRDYVRHRDFDPQFVMISNTLAITRIDASFAGIFMAMERLLPLFGMFRTEALSVIHAHGDIAFGVSRIVQQVVEPVSRFRFEITRSESEALALGGQPEPDFASLDRNLGLDCFPPVQSQPGLSGRAG